MFLKRAVDLDIEHAVVGANHTSFVPDKGDVDLGVALQHVVGADAVEGGELMEQRDDCLNTHVGVLSNR
jgi:hypothetical protein